MQTEEKTRITVTWDGLAGADQPTKIEADGPLDAAQMRTAADSIIEKIKEEYKQKHFVLCSPARWSTWGFDLIALDKMEAVEKMKKLRISLKTFDDDDWKIITRGTWIRHMTEDIHLFVYAQCNPEEDHYMSNLSKMMYVSGSSNAEIDSLNREIEEIEQYE